MPVIFFLCFLLSLEVGERVFPFMLTWNGVDRRAEPFYASVEGPDKGAGRFYARSDHGLAYGLAMSAHGEGDGNSLGGTAYAETAGTGWATGFNAIGATYGEGSAAGIEVNGVNRSGSPRTVYGAYIVNGGNASTKAAVVVETSGSEPQGKPLIGLWLKADGTIPAGETGIRIDAVDSGEAFRMSDDLRIALSNDGQTYLRYSSSRNRVQIVRHGQVVGEF